MGTSIISPTEYQIIVNNILIDYCLLSLIIISKKQQIRTIFHYQKWANNVCIQQEKLTFKYVYINLLFTNSIFDLSTLKNCVKPLKKCIPFIGGHVGLVLIVRITPALYMIQKV